MLYVIILLIIGGSVVLQPCEYWVLSSTTKKRKNERSFNSESVNMKILLDFNLTFFEGKWTWACQADIFFLSGSGQSEDNYSSQSMPASEAYSTQWWHGASPPPSLLTWALVESHH